MSSMRIVSIVLIGIVAVTAWLFLDDDRRWLFFNRQTAETYARVLLADDANRQVPDKFIDYTISTTNGGVMFASHTADDKIYGYFPNGIGQEQGAGFKWDVLDGDWYLANEKVRPIK